MRGFWKLVSWFVRAAKDRVPADLLVAEATSPKLGGVVSSAGSVSLIGLEVARQGKVRGLQSNEDLSNGDRDARKLHELLSDFDSAMLVTRTAAGESRPMAVADSEDDGELWFVTERHSGKLEEIARDSHVNVAMQSRMKFVSISGTAVAVDDPRKVAEIWNEAWKVWFPGGKDDPTLTLLKVHATQGEYWDNTGMSGVKYLIEAGKANLSGTKPDVAGDPKVHGKVRA